MRLCYQCGTVKVHKSFSHNATECKTCATHRTQEWRIQKPRQYKKATKQRYEAIMADPEKRLTHALYRSIYREAFRPELNAKRRALAAAKRRF